MNQSQQQEIDSLIKQIDSLSSTINDSNLKQSEDYDNLLSTINTLIDNTNNLTNQKFEILSDSIKNIRGELIAVSLESNNLSSQLSNLSSELEALKNDSLSYNISFLKFLCYNFIIHHFLGSEIFELIISSLTILPTSTTLSLYLSGIPSSSL